MMQEKKNTHWKWWHHCRVLVQRRKLADHGHLSLFLDCQWKGTRCLKLLPRWLPTMMNCEQTLPSSSGFCQIFCHSNQINNQYRHPDSRAESGWKGALDIISGLTTHKHRHTRLHLQTQDIDSLVCTCKDSSHSLCLSLSQQLLQQHWECFYQENKRQCEEDL